MKLLIRGICVVTLALVVGGLVALLSASGLSAQDALTREELAAGLVNISDKLAIATALMCMFLAGLRDQWRWVIALGAAAAVTLFSGPLSAVTNTGPAIYIITPLVTATLMLVYVARTPNLTPARTHRV